MGNEAITEMIEYMEFLSRIERYAIIGQVILCCLMVIVIVMAIVNFMRDYG